MSVLQNGSLRAALERIGNVTPLLRTPVVPEVIIDVHKEKMRAANSQQLWVTDAPSVPDMQLTASKATYLKRLLDREPEDAQIFHAEFDTMHRFTVGPTAVQLVKPLTNLYRNVEEVLLKPVLTNDDLLAVDTNAFDRAAHDVLLGTGTRVIRLLLLPGVGVTVSGRDELGNGVSVEVAGEYSGKKHEVFFPSGALSTLTKLLEDNVTNFKFGPGTKYRPAPLLATDHKSGLTVVLSPTHE